MGRLRDGHNAGRTCGHCFCHHTPGTFDFASRCAALENPSTNLLLVDFLHIRSSRSFRNVNRTAANQCPAASAGT